MKDEILLKIIVAGDGGVGKTTLLHYYINREFLSDSKMTIGVQFFPTTLTINNKTYRVMFWDVGGQERFRELIKSFLGGTMGAIYMFDLSNLFTLERVGEWLDLLRENNDNLPILLVGSKYDLIKEIEDRNTIKHAYEYIIQIKRRYNFFDYIITSSKIGYNIDNAFTILLEKVINQYKIQSILDQLNKYKF